MVNETTIVSDLCKYAEQEIPEIIAKVEQNPDSRGRKRCDISVRRRNNRKLLFTGEFKKPTVIEGKSPRHYDLVDNAFTKSAKAGSRFWITSNFNETIIWDNKDHSRPLFEKDIKTIYLEKNIKSENDFEKDEFENILKKMIVDVIKYIINLFDKKITIKYRELGESFIEGFNSHLNTIVDVSYKYVEDKLLMKWWKEQNYEPVKFENEHKRILAKYTAYKLGNKIIFYYVMKRSFELPDIIIPNEINSIKNIKSLIENAFDEAEETSGDFQPIFEKHNADNILFKHNDLIEPIRNFLNFLLNYKIETIKEDIIGNIFDRLISPEQRHALGQYYTDIPIVNLINALTIKNSNDRTMDSSCGTGTFLVKSFDLKMKLSKEKDSKELREKMFEQIFGVDIAPYPVHIAQISLSSRLLHIDPSIYPKIIRKNFLEVDTQEIKPVYNELFFEKSKSYGKTLSGKKRLFNFKPIDAAVGNLPYIRQEKIENKEKQIERIKNIFKKYGFKEDCPNNTSDFYIYFWYYILPFLREGSRVGFLTSDTWMNVEYGDDFKRFINKYFKIIAIIDSSVERWFEDALVNTSIMILERKSNTKERENNKIKFIRINKKLSEIVTNIDDAIKIANQIEKGKSTKDIKIVRKIKQKDIDFNDKLKLKFFPYLKAQNEFFDFINSENMISLSKIMDISFGIKTGANKFFYVNDVTNKYTKEELKIRFGLKKGETEIKVIRNGKGEEFLIEKEYLKPILKSPKEFTKDGKLFINNFHKQVILINETKKSKIKRYALEYIEYGENNPKEEPYCKRATCASRNPWWKLSPIVIPDMVFPMHFYQKYIYPKINVLIDAALYYGKMKKEYKNDLLSIYSFMNSSLSFLYQDFFGRNYGGGNIQFKVYETELLPIIKPEILRPYYKDLEKIMKKIEKRKIGNVFEEIWDMKEPFSLDQVKPDRLELDRTLLIAIGYENPDEFLKKWYLSIIKIIKERSDKAASLKTTKTEKTNFGLVADEILKHVDIKDFPNDYLSENDIKEKIEIKTDKDVTWHDDFSAKYIELKNGKKYTLYPHSMVNYLNYCKKRKMFDIPIPKDVKPILKEFKNDLSIWSSKIEKEIKDITNDEKYQDKLKKICERKTNYIDILFKD